ncbi:MAG: bifunctional isocitrate dehydrogenase kinase/phosphatase [Pseudomonadota bacterium]
MHACAHQVFIDFVRYNSEFRSITQRAKQRFEQRKWAASRADAVERIQLYDNCVNATVARVRELFEQTPTCPILEERVWHAMRRRFAENIATYRDIEFTRTYFNSVARRVFGVADAVQRIVFQSEDSQPLAQSAHPLGVRRYALQGGSLTQLFTVLLADYPFAVTYRDIVSSGDHVASEVREFLESAGAGEPQLVEMIGPVFFRDTRAYLVGRLTSASRQHPLLIALRNAQTGIEVDAVLLDDDEVSFVFGFARSYFHVDLESVTSAVIFLHSIMPHKSVVDLFTMLGRAKQGKTQRYHEIREHLALSSERFRDAALDKGMVMIVFALPSYGGVFKVIRDNFAYPKTTTRQDVKDKYRLVATHDRVGRLVEAQEFAGMKFAADRFEPTLRDELLNEATASTHLEGENTLVLDHVYVERRLIPLNKYLREASGEDRMQVVIDYGQAIRDLAHANIFPGDLLLKNFGVSRQRRVVFFDYDELCLVTDCNFRDPVQAAYEEDEMRPSDWFYVAENDVFPHQFASFLGFGGELRDRFLELHGELFTAAWWRDVKARHERGEVLELVPYRRRGEQDALRDGPRDGLEEH